MKQWVFLILTILVPGMALAYIPSEPTGGGQNSSSAQNCGNLTCAKAAVTVYYTGNTIYGHDGWTTNPNWYSWWRYDSNSPCGNNCPTSAWARTEVWIGQFYDATVPCCKNSEAYASANTPPPPPPPPPGNT